MLKLAEFGERFFTLEPCLNRELRRRRRWRMVQTRTFKKPLKIRRSNLLPELNKLIEVQELDKVIQEVLGELERLPADSRPQRRPWRP